LGQELELGRAALRFSKALRQGGSTVVGGAVISGSNPGTITPVEPGLIQDPAGGVTGAGQGSSTTNAAPSSTTFSPNDLPANVSTFTVTNGVVIGTTVTNINEPSGAANPANPVANGAGTSGQGFTQNLVNAINPSASSSQGNPVVMLVTADGTVILRGTVSSETERRNMEARIQSVAGVTGVRNELDVAGSGLPTAPQP
jgi:hypothetical protein